MVAVPLALFLILILLYFAFGSIKALMVYSAIPLSAVGGYYFMDERIAFYFRRSSLLRSLVLRFSTESY
jgi:Cu/Ag efflux pump CusA